MEHRRGAVWVSSSKDPASCNAAACLVLTFAVSCSLAAVAAAD